MGRWTDIAPRQETIPNCGPYRMTAHYGVVIHIAEGTYEGTIGWFHNPAASTGSHFVVPKDGDITQLIDTDINSWCQADGNMTWISVENAGYGGEQLTQAQLVANAKILRKAHEVYGVPLQNTSDPYGRGLCHHSAGGAAWGGHTMCPGVAIIAQKPTIVALAAGTTPSSSTTDSTPEDLDNMVSLLKLKGHPEVFKTDGLHAVHIPDPNTLKDILTLHAEGTLKLGNDGKVREVSNAALLGRIKAPVPVGYEAYAEK